MKAQPSEIRQRGDAKGCTVTRGSVPHKPLNTRTLPYVQQAEDGKRTWGEATPESLGAWGEPIQPRAGEPEGQPCPYRRRARALIAAMASTLS